MRIHSIRVKVMLPIISLAAILVGLFVFMLLMSALQTNAMRTQAEHYFEAISEVLNADRDIYQARLAQEKLLTGEGNREKNLQDFSENAQQVSDRFQLYRRYLAGEPKELVEPFNEFDNLLINGLVKVSNYRLIVMLNKSALFMKFSWIISLMRFERCSIKPVRAFEKKPESYKVTFLQPN